jgi:hypothetical protein
LHNEELVLLRDLGISGTIWSSVKIDVKEIKYEGVD